MITTFTEDTSIKSNNTPLKYDIPKHLEELYIYQHEQIAQLHRFAEFGKYSAGFFHDLINPLTAISLTLGCLKNSKKVDYSDTKKMVDIAVSAAERMNTYMDSIKHQIKPERIMEWFLIANEIENICSILDFKARTHSVEIKCNYENTLVLYGNALKFNQMICNLISNAIDSYRPLEFDKNPKRRIVKVTIIPKGSHLVIAVKDRGIGIRKELREKLFHPFFTTKKNGIGLGLATVKNTVDKHFNGSIKLASHPGSGTTFTVTIPFDQTLNKKMEVNPSN